MKRFLFLLAFIPVSVLLKAQTATLPDSVIIKKISDEIFVSGEVYRNEEYLCKKIGARLSGSEGAEKAVKWTKQLMEQYSFDTVYLQEVMVPHWVRGEKETGYFFTPGEKKENPVDIVALGGSIATPEKGLTAEIIEVKDFDELKKLGTEKIKGKIVFYNHPFDVKMILPFSMYSEAGKYRYKGAAEAARYGAVGSIVRSMTNYIDDYPHTGGMAYNDTFPKIPACAISTLDAEALSAALKNGSETKFYFKMSCEMLPDVKSYNVIGELRGSQHPEEIITVGGHLDSWDLAEGAHDDGTGVMQSIEVLRTLKIIGIKPKRTIRVVMFMNEENGLRGGNEYGKQALMSGEKHILAIETDAGGFTPRGFSMSMGEEKKAAILKWKDYFFPYGVYDFTQKGGGADIGPLEKAGVPVMGLEPDNQRYFIIHHTALDTFEQVNKRELELGAITLTMLVYLVSEHGF